MSRDRARKLRIACGPSGCVRRNQYDEPLAIDFTAVLKHGDAGRLAQLLAADPGLARCVVEDLASRLTEKGALRAPRPR